MPVNLGIRNTLRLHTVVVGTKSCGNFVVQPRYRAWLKKLGLTSAEAMLNLRGEVVSGHHDRHVRRVELSPGRFAWLKREHRVGWRVRLKNWRDGFGAVSRSQREAAMLTRLDALALPGPQWIAYGRDARGRAFLLIEDLAPSVDLRTASLCEGDPGIRRDAVRMIGRVLAGFDRAGVTLPDLSAKHVFIHPDSGRMTLIDWPSARFAVAATPGMVASLARLNASLPGPLASPRERLRVLREFLKSSGKPRALREWCRQIRKAEAFARRKSAVRQQQCSLAIAEKQRLVWLADDESVCAAPALASCWPTPAVAHPYYAPGDSFENGRCLPVTAPDGAPATLIRWRSRTFWPRFCARLRGRSWRSPAATLARAIFARQLAGVPAPALLAFGQRGGESFALIRTGEDAAC